MDTGWGLHVLGLLVWLASDRLLLIRVLGGLVLGLGIGFFAGVCVCRGYKKLVDFEGVGVFG